MEGRPRWRFDVPSSLLTLAVVALGGAVYGISHRPHPPLSAEERIADDIERIQALKKGYVGTLIRPGAAPVDVGRTAEDYQAIVEAEESGDDLGLREIMASGRGFQVPSGTSARLDGKGAFGALRLHFTGGDEAEEEGWADGEFYH